jgi:hypothetical protein
MKLVNKLGEEKSLMCRLYALDLTVLNEKIIKSDTHIGPLLGCVKIEIRRKGLGVLDQLFKITSKKISLLITNHKRS